VRAVRRQAKFVIVGSTSPTVRAFASRSGVLVTGPVLGSQPYRRMPPSLWRLYESRRVHNKVLEALAMGMTDHCHETLTAIGTPVATPVIAAETADAWIAAFRARRRDCTTFSPCSNSLPHAAGCAIMSL